jgi:hypothetical protein
MREQPELTRGHTHIKVAIQPQEKVSSRTARVWPSFPFLLATTLLTAFLPFSIYQSLPIKQSIKYIALSSAFFHFPCHWDHPDNSPDIKQHAHLHLSTTPLATRFLPGKVQITLMVLIDKQNHCNVKLFYLFLLWLWVDVYILVSCQQLSYILFHAFLPPFCQIL